MAPAPSCTGLGTKKRVDPELVIPDPSLPLSRGAIQPWSTGHNAEYFGRLLTAVADHLGFDVDTPWERLPARVQAALLEGLGDEQIHVRYRNRFNRERSYYTNFEGVIAYLDRRHREAESDSARERWEGYLRDIPCPTCRGTRLKPESLAVTMGGRSIAEVAEMSIADAAAFLGSLELTDRESQIAGRVLKEVDARLAFLLDVGLDYLSLDRAAGTLAGGEAQRIRLATQIGSGLVGVLYVLDEPSIGLHQRDNRRLIDTLVRLRDLGNTLIVVEHDEDTIRAADWAVDIGPGAGEHGGHVVVSGPVQELLDSEESLTGAYLSGRRSIPIPDIRRAPDPSRRLTVHDAREHNLRDVTVGFPLGCFVAVTGVSGSGKSSLVNDILASVLANKLNGAREVPGRHRTVSGLEHLDKVVRVDQSPIGRTPRSNPATYTGVFDNIRKLFAETTEAKVRGYLPGRFSFNVKGGRCEACAGDGTIKIEMNFLPDVYVPCEVCHGARYNRETLEVHFKGKSIAEVLDMSIEEGADFFAGLPSIARHLKTLVDVGLGYVRLGQPAPTLSGGEAQRVKLASELQKRSTGRTIYVLDEPTTGLHFEDVRKLLGVLGRLVDQGNSVIVIEHNLDVIKTADWVVDLGPEGGTGGGRVVAEGTPEEVAAVPESHTGRFLEHVLGDRVAAKAKKSGAGDGAGLRRRRAGRRRPSDGGKSRRRSAASKAVEVGTAASAQRRRAAAKSAKPVGRGRQDARRPSATRRPSGVRPAKAPARRRRAAAATSGERGSSAPQQLVDHEVERFGGALFAGGVELVGPIEEAAHHRARRADPGRPPGPGQAQQHPLPSGLGLDVHGPVAGRLLQAVAQEVAQHDPGSAGQRRVVGRAADDEVDGQRVVLAPAEREHGDALVRAGAAPSARAASTRPLRPEARRG